MLAYVALADCLESTTSESIGGNIAGLTALVHQSSLINTDVPRLIYTSDLKIVIMTFFYYFETVHYEMLMQ